MTVVLLEGWCVGFQPLDERTLQQKWQQAVEHSGSVEYEGRLGANRFEDIDFINTSLAEYTPLFR